MRLGIDFGTTRTVVAAQENGNYPVCTFSWEGEVKEYIPTLVAVKDGILHFGWDAVDRLNQPDTHILRSMKRLAGHLRPEDPVELGPDFSITLLELVTLFLTHVRQMILKHGNITLKKKDAIEVMVASPANANSNQRYITLEAFRRAGFTVLGAMNEPSAAAVEFLHRYLRDLGPKSPKRYVAVYDLGGGTFDTSVVGIADRNHDVVAHEGIGRLGGDDFDEIILSLALEQMGLEQENLTPSNTARLLEECRERKEGLKSNTKKMVVDPGMVLQDQKPVVLDTGLVYERCGSLIERSLSTLKNLLRGIDQDPEDSRSLAAVYLVGGSVSFPPVSRKLREAYREQGEGFSFSPCVNRHRAEHCRRSKSEHQSAGIRLPSFRHLAGEGQRQDLRSHLPQRPAGGFGHGPAPGHPNVQPGAQHRSAAIPGVQFPRKGRRTGGGYCVVAGCLFPL